MTLWSYEAADIVDCDDNEQEAKKEEEGRIWRKRRIKGKKKTLGIRIWVRMAKGLEMMMMKRWLNKKEGWGWRWAQQSMKDMDIDEGLMVLCKTVLQLGIRIWVRMAKDLEMMMMKRWLNKKEGWGWRWAQQSMKDMDIDGGLWQHKERYIGHH